jgi:carbohydrate-binding DOMON domain-containing protein
MMPRPKSRSRVPPGSAVGAVLGSWRKGKIHQVGNGGLTSATIGIPHGALMVVSTANPERVEATCVQIQQ